MNSHALDAGNDIITSTSPTNTLTSKMNFEMLFIRNRDANGDLPPHIIREVLRDPDSHSQGPGSRDEIQAGIEAHMRTLETCLIMIMADQRIAADRQDRRCSPAEEGHLEHVASLLRGSLQTLREKRDRLVQERANGESLWK